jgi:hypothetical protein
VLLLAVAGCQQAKNLNEQRCYDAAKGKDGVGCGCVYYRGEQAIYQPVPTAHVRYCLSSPDFEECLCSGTVKPINP